ncbi:MAG: DUF4124 domain-containing protein [Marinobacter sp.]|nr:DUF4124 domain-containing protein [Marinobacter sp.]
MNLRILMLALIMCATPGLATGASVYKWTDENGVTHFGDRQPTGSKAEQVDVRSGTRSPTGERQSPQERLNELEQNQQNEAQEREETAAEEARRKQREANCATARSNLDVINSNARIRTEGEDGEPRYLSPEEIEERRQEFEKIAEENCDPE